MRPTSGSTPPTPAATRTGPSSSATPKASTWPCTQATPPGWLPAFVHFGFQLPDADAVRALLARMEADEVLILERWDEPGYVAFKCLDPDGWRVEAYWEQVS